MSHFDPEFAAEAADAARAFVAYEGAQDEYEGDETTDTSDADWAAGGEPSADELLGFDPDSADDSDGTCPCCFEELGDDAVEVTTTFGTSLLCPGCWLRGESDLGLLRHEAEALSDGAPGPAERVSRELRVETHPDPWPPATLALARLRARRLLDLDTSALARLAWADLGALQRHLAARGDERHRVVLRLLAGLRRGETPSSSDLAALLAA